MKYILFHENNEFMLFNYNSLGKKIKRNIKYVLLNFKIQGVPGKLLHMFLFYVNGGRTIGNRQLIHKLMIYICVDANTSHNFKISLTRLLACCSFCLPQVYWRETEEERFTLKNRYTRFEEEH